MLEKSIWIAILLIEVLFENRCSLVDAVDLDFDYHKFVMQWPGTVCTLESCPDIWTIHGLWPTRNDGQDPNKHIGVYNKTVIEELKNNTKLETLWPALDKRKKNEDFWEHEWNKHGSCSKLGFENYFKETLALANKYNFGRILDQYEVLQNERIKVDNIKNAVRNITGRIPIVKTKCLNNKKSLFEIEICLNVTLQPIDCEEYIFYPGVKKAKNLKAPAKLVQANENGCELSTNGQTRIQMFSPILLTILLWHCDMFFLKT